MLIVDGHEDINKVMGISSVNISLSVAGVQGLRVNRTSGFGGEILGIVDLYEPHQQGLFAPNYCFS